MFKPQKVLVGLGVGIVFFTLAGCSSKTAEPQQYSGFMQDYSDLKPVETSTGHQALRWVAPGFEVNNYKSIYFAPVVYYPPATPNSRVSASTLEQIRLYTEQRLKGAVSSRAKMSNQPQPGGLTMKTAITAVSAENKDIRVYELLPVTAVIAGTMSVTGNRSQNTYLFIEAVLTDVTTHKPVLKVVRKAYGGAVANSNAQITQADLKNAIDDMVTDVAQFSR